MQQAQTISKTVLLAKEKGVVRKLPKTSSLITVLNRREEYFIDENGFFVGCNFESVNVTGYESDEIVGRHFSILYPPDASQKAEVDLERARQFGRANISGLMVKKRGVTFWARMKIKATNQLYGERSSFTILLQDATHCIISRSRIKKLQGEYLSIFNNPFVGTFKFGMASGLVHMCNQKTQDILKVKCKSGFYFRDIFSSLEHYELFISLLKENRELEGFRFLVADYDNPIENWAVISAKYFEAEGFVEGVIVDITEQYAQMQELVRVNTELDHFVYHASHDLRSPLTTMLGLITLSFRESSIETVFSYLQMIKGRILHMDGLLKDLMSISFNNGLEPEYATFQFEEEVAGITKLFHDRIRDFDIIIDVRQNCPFNTDPVRMRTILKNLLSNSINYYNPAISNPKVMLRIRVTSSHCAIQLKDNGIGIAGECKSKVYNLFYRANERSSGSGLGLYVVKSMLERMKGKISFESTPNVGTTFLLTVPNHA